MRKTERLLPPDQRLLTLTEAAAALRVHPNTLRHWSDTGLVPTIRTAGGHRRYMPAAIRETRAKLGLANDAATEPTTLRASDV